MAEVLVDTDVFVDHLRGARAFRPGRRQVHYSTITRCELFAGSEDEQEAVRRLLAPFGEVDVDRAVAERAGTVRRRSGLLIPDALIAASALVHGMRLMTRNRRDFEHVPGLRLAEVP